MPEKSGRAHTEADFVYCVCLGVDAFKIISTAIMLLQLLFLTRQSGSEGFWEEEVALWGAAVWGWDRRAHSPLSTLSLLLAVRVSHGHSTVQARGLQMTPG